MFYSNNTLMQQSGEKELSEEALESISLILLNYSKIIKESACTMKDPALPYEKIGEQEEKGDA